MSVQSSKELDLTSQIHSARDYIATLESEQIVTSINAPHVSRRMRYLGADHKTLAPRVIDATSVWLGNAAVFVPDISRRLPKRQTRLPSCMQRGLCAERKRERERLEDQISTSGTKARTKTTREQVEGRRSSHSIMSSPVHKARCPVKYKHYSTPATTLRSPSSRQTV